METFAWISLIATIILVAGYITERVKNVKLKEEFKEVTQELVDLTGELLQEAQEFKEGIIKSSLDNAIMILITYWKHGTWCFTDAATGLVDEAFVAGADKQISYLVKKYNIINPELGFKIYISATWFPDCEFITHLSPDTYGSGNYYRYVDGDTVIDGWYCPALFKYFPTAPEKIYCKVESL